MTDPALMRELEFTHDDLIANREGRLSEMQIYRLKLQRQRSIMIGAGVMLALAFAASLCIFGGVQGSSILMVIGLGLTVCSAVIMGTFARYWLRLSSDINEKNAAAFSGTLERVIKPVNNRIATYLLRVDGAEFSVTKDTFKLFAHDTGYTLYRTKYTGKLLSVEKI